MIKYQLELNKNISVNVNIYKKPIKNFYLKIFKNKDIKLSIPKNTKIEQAYNFIDNKKLWINNHILKVINNNQNVVKEKFYNGGYVYILGRKYNIVICKNKENKIETKDLNLIIYSKKYNDINYVNKQYFKYLKEKSFLFFQEKLNKYYSILKKYNIQKPILNVRKMRTKWGNCNVKNNKIILNVSLFKTTVGCIEYIILHELAHLIYLRHNEYFYKFLNLQMPQWTKYKEQLDTKFYGLIDK